MKVVVHGGFDNSLKKFFKNFTVIDVLCLIYQTICALRLQIGYKALEFGLCEIGQTFNMLFIILRDLGYLTVYQHVV